MRDYSVLASIKMKSRCIIDDAFDKGYEQGYQDGTKVKDTGVLYYKGTYLLAPYISENGKFCKLVNGEIVEIDEENEVRKNE